MQHRLLVRVVPLSLVAALHIVSSACAGVPSPEQAAAIIQSAVTDATELADIDVTALVSQRQKAADWNQLHQGLRRALVLNLPAGTSPQTIEKQEIAARENADRIWREMNSDNLQWIRYRRVGKAWRVDLAPFKGEESMPEAVDTTTVFSPLPDPKTTTIDHGAKLVSLRRSAQDTRGPEWLDPRGARDQWGRVVRRILSDATSSDVKLGEAARAEFVAAIRRDTPAASGARPWVVEAVAEQAGRTRITAGFPNVAQPLLESTFEDAQLTRISHVLLREPMTGRIRIERKGDRFDADGVPRRVEETVFDAKGDVESRRVFEVVAFSLQPGDQQTLFAGTATPPGYQVLDTREP